MEKNFSLQNKCLAIANACSNLNELLNSCNLNPPGYVLVGMDIHNEVDISSGTDCFVANGYPVNYGRRREAEYCTRNCYKYIAAVYCQVLYDEGKPFLVPLLNDLEVLDFDIVGKFFENFSTSLGEGTLGETLKLGQIYSIGLANKMYHDVVIHCDFYPAQAGSPPLHLCCNIDNAVVSVINDESFTELQNFDYEKVIISDFSTYTRDKNQLIRIERPFTVNENSGHVRLTCS